jgi:hypothetical protein
VSNKIGYDVLQDLFETNYGFVVGHLGVVVVARYQEVIGSPQCLPREAKVALRIDAQLRREVFDVHRPVRHPAPWAVFIV